MGCSWEGAHGDPGFPPSCLSAALLLLRGQHDFLRALLVTCHQTEPLAGLGSFLGLRDKFCRGTRHWAQLGRGNPVIPRPKPGPQTGPRMLCSNPGDLYTPQVSSAPRGWRADLGLPRCASPPWCPTERVESEVHK